MRKIIIMSLLGVMMMGMQVINAQKLMCPPATYNGLTATPVLAATPSSVSFEKSAGGNIREGDSITLHIALLKHDVKNPDLMRLECSYDIDHDGRDNPTVMVYEAANLKFDPASAFVPDTWPGVYECNQSVAACFVDLT